MELTTKLSPNFTLGEMLRSATADAMQRRDVDKYNEQYNPPQAVVDALTNLCVKTLQPISNYTKDKYPNSYIKISSGFRCAWVNKAIGGATSSQHKKGEAADTDLIVDGVERNDLYVKCLQEMEREGLLVFDQIILEFGSTLNPSWVHISCKLNGPQRSIVLRKAQGKPYEIYQLFK